MRRNLAPYLAASIRTPRRGCPSCPRGFFVPGAQDEQSPPRDVRETKMSEQETQHGEAATYDVAAVQDKWLPVWDELDPFRADDDSPREKKYALTMFPYPSGDLHMGHAEVTALHDVIARYWWQRGYEVLNPMGWDSFGLPAENAAIRNNEHPATYTYANIETQYESFKRYGISFDWSRRLHTSDPEYYRWTQWLFLKFRERGLAYRKNSPVNWCPNDQTVLANEQVVDGTLRALRRRGHQARADPVVLQDHRVRPGAAGRPGRPGADLADAGRHRPAQLDRSVRGCARRLRGRGSRRADHRLHDPAGHDLRYDVHGGRGRLPAGRGAGHRRAARRVRGLPRGDPQGDRDRAAVHRPAQDRRRPGRHGDQPGDRHADPGLGDRLRAGRLRHRRGHGRARRRPARLGVRHGHGPADRPDHRAAGRLRGRGVHRRGAGDQLAAPGVDAPLDINGLGVAEAKRATIAFLEQQETGRARSTSGCATGC